MNELIKKLTNLKNGLQIKKSYNSLDETYNQVYHTEIVKNFNNTIAEITEGVINRANISLKVLEYTSLIDELIEKRKKIENFNDKNSTIERAKITSYIDFLTQLKDVLNDEIGEELKDTYKN